MTTTGLYKVTEIINDAFRAEGFNTLTFDDVEAIDLNKATIYPLMHISLASISHALASQEISFDITWADIVYKGKPLNPAEVPDNFSNASNTEDIFHDLNYRINRAWLSLKKNTDLIVELPENLVITSFYARAQNELAGYEATLVITIEGGNIC